MQKCVIFTPPRISLGFLRHLAENNVLCPFARPGLSENSQSPGGVPKTQCDDIPDVFPLLAGYFHRFPRAKRAGEILRHFCARIAAREVPANPQNAARRYSGRFPASGGRGGRWRNLHFSPFFFSCVRVLHVGKIATDLVE